MTDLSGIYAGNAGLVALLLRAFGRDAEIKFAKDERPKPGVGRPGFDVCNVRCAVWDAVRAEGETGAPEGSPGLRREIETFKCAVDPDGLPKAPRPERDFISVAGKDFRIVSVGLERVGDIPVAFMLTCRRA